MRVKNIGHKIIGFGQTTVLPGETVTIPDTFNGNPTIATYEALGYITVIEDKTAAKTGDKTEKTAKGGKSKTAGTTDETTTETDGEAEAGKE